MARGRRRCEAGGARAGLAFRTAAAAFFSLCWVFHSLQADITITVADASRHVHTFGGFGVSTNNGAYPEDEQYQEFAAWAREEMARLTWKDAGFSVLRIWAYLDKGAPEDYLLQYYQLFIDEALAQNPNITLLYGPTGWASDGNVESEMRAYGKKYADQVNFLKNNGYVITTSGVVNEEGDHPGEPWHGTPPEYFHNLLKMYKDEFVKVGLDYVKIIGPECSNVDDYSAGIIQSVIDDPEALKAIDGFSTHCYSWCLKKWFFDIVEPTGKEYWMTESSGDDWAQPKKAASEINLGVTHWIQFLGYTEYDPNPSERYTRMMWYRSDIDKVEVFQKYYNLKALSLALVPGTRIRLCQSSDGNTWMEVGGGALQAPIAAACGVNPEGKWVLTAVSSTDQNVVFDVEELRGEASLDFDVYRTNSQKDREQEEPVTMNEGKVSVFAGNKNIVALVATRATEEPLQVERPAFRTAPPRTAASGLSLAVIGGGRAPLAFEFTIPQGTGQRVHMAAYDAQGKMVATLLDAGAAPGKHRASWDRCAADRGVYIVKLLCPPLPARTVVVVRN